MVYGIIDRVKYITLFIILIMAKDLAISEDQVKKLVNIGVTGHDIGASNVYPSSINILQSDKQYEAFVDGEDITKKMYGKLFVRTESNTTKDLVDSIKGTIIKIERGFEIRTEDNKIEESGYGFLDSLQKAEYESQGFKPINMVKILIALEDFKTTQKKMDEIKEKLEAGKSVDQKDYPFAVAVVKGSSFGNWFDAEKQMQDLANNVFNRPLSQIPTIAYSIEVSSKKEEGTDFTYYSMDFNITPNDPEEAIKFTPFLLEAKEQNLFYKVKERVHDEEVDEAKEAEIEQIKEIEEDLPF